MKRVSSNIKGFTLVELVITMVILGVLATSGVNLILPDKQEHLDVCREMSLSLRAVQNTNMNEGYEVNSFFKIVKQSNAIVFGTCSALNYSDCASNITDSSNWNSVTTSQNVTTNVASTNQTIRFNSLGQLIENNSNQQRTANISIVISSSSGECSISINREGGISWSL